MRLLPLLLAALPLVAACGTTHASVPDIGPAEARSLVLQDLAELCAQPSEARWSRAYRHLDRHLEPHLQPSERLAIEVRFGALRRGLKMDRPDRERVVGLCEDLERRLQPAE